MSHSETKERQHRQLEEQWMQGMSEAQEDIIKLLQQLNEGQDEQIRLITELLHAARQ